MVVSCTNSRQIELGGFQKSRLLGLCLMAFEAAEPDRRGRFDVIIPGARSGAAVRATSIISDASLEAVLYLASRGALLPFCAPD